MVKKYAKGYRAEWSLTHELSNMGFMVIRAPRSGRIGIASPDILAIKNGKIFVIECKSRKNGFKIEQDQLDQLKAWEDRAGATALIVWKIHRHGWTFLTMQDVAENNGNVGKKFAEEKGFNIDCLKQL